MIKTIAQIVPLIEFKFTLCKVTSNVAKSFEVLTIKLGLLVSKAVCSSTHGSYVWTKSFSTCFRSWANNTQAPVTWGAPVRVSLFWLALWWSLSDYGGIAAQRLCLLIDYCCCYHAVIRQHSSVQIPEVASAAGKQSSESEWSVQIQGTFKSARAHRRDFFCERLIFYSSN